MNRTSKLLVAVVVLQALVLMGQWTGSSIATPAHAQIPDAGGQRHQMVEELRALNAKVDKLIGIIESGKLQVKAAASDEKGR